MRVFPLLPSIEFSERTDPGRDPEKQINEDSCGYRETPFGHLFVICDGMGGHAGGREASQTALSTLFRVFEQADVERDGRDVLKDAVIEANRSVVAMDPFDDSGRHPGSTLVALLHHQNGTDFANVGDSRGYWIHTSQIVQVTKDHSIVQQLVDAGALTPAQAAVHPEANKIYRALGIESEVLVEMHPSSIPHEAGDIFLLCSDGLTDRIEDSEILAIATEHPIEIATNKLIELANARGGHDNISVQMVRVHEDAKDFGGRVKTLLIHPASIANVDHRSNRRRPLPLPVVLTLVLAAGALVLAGLLLVRHFQDRRGQHHHEVPLENQPAMRSRGELNRDAVPSKETK